MVAAKLRLRARIVVVALRRSGARAILALAAVGLGIAATTLTLAISAGAARELEAVAAQLGRNLFSVSAGQVLSTPGRGRGWYTSSRLDRDDAALLAAELSGAAAVAPVLDGTRRAVFGRESTVTNVRGVTPEYLELRRFEVAAGRALDADDERARARVALVGAFVAERLTVGGADLLGRIVRVGGVPFEVVGLLRRKGASADGQNEDDQILVPLETARRRLYGREALSRLLVQADEAERMDSLQASARSLLRESHRLGEGMADDFDVVRLVRTSEARRLSQSFLEGMSRLFAITALTIGGVGVLAVTVLNVKERTAEIGLRRALGARRKDVVALFVTEACALSGAGGLAGLAVGAAAVAILEATLGWRMAIEPAGVATAFLLSVALGVAFAAVPALRAARLVPVEALRDQ